jgi:hypothetical protein
MRTEFDPTPPHNRVPDYSACPKCVRELRPEPFATDYVTMHNQLWGFCTRHHTRWYVTRAMYGFPDISNRPAALTKGYREVTPLHRFAWANRDIASLPPSTLDEPR